MKKIAWITDSTATLEASFIKEHNLVVFPMVINFNGEVFKDGVDITETEFYESLSLAKELPKTSQPNIGEMVETYKELKKEYDMGIAIHISSDLSGTASASRQAAEMAGFPIEWIDSRMLSLPMAELIIRGKELIGEGKTPEETAEILRNMHENCQLYVTVGSLEQLHKGGRVSMVQLMVGSLLQIKPILNLSEGKIEPYEKVRSQKKAFAQMISYLEKDVQEGHAIKKVYVLHGNAEEEIQLLIERIKEVHPQAEIVKGTLGAAIGVHAGAGTIGISWFKE